MVKVSSAASRITPSFESPSYPELRIRPVTDAVAAPPSEYSRSYRLFGADAVRTVRTRELPGLPAHGRQTDHFSLRLHPSGLYQLGIQGDCKVKTRSNSSGESGIVQLDMKGPSLIHPNSMDLVFRSSNLLVQLSVYRGQLLHFYSELRQELGEMFVVTVCKKGWDCFYKERSDGDFRCLAKGFDVSGTLTSKDGLQNTKRLGPDLTWSSNGDAPVSTGAISNSSFKAELQCGDRNFRLTASISIVDSRIQSADFIADCLDSRSTGV